MIMLKTLFDQELTVSIKDPKLGFYNLDNDLVIPDPNKLIVRNEVTYIPLIYDQWLGLSKDLEHLNRSIGSIGLGSYKQPVVSYMDPIGLYNQYLNVFSNRLFKYVIGLNPSNNFSLWDQMEHFGLYHKSASKSSPFLFSSWLPSKFGHLATTGLWISFDPGKRSADQIKQERYFSLFESICLNNGFEIDPNQPWKIRFHPTKDKTNTLPSFYINIGAQDYTIFKNASRSLYTAFCQLVPTSTFPVLLNGTDCETRATMRIPGGDLEERDWLRWFIQFKMQEQNLVFPKEVQNEVLTQAMSWFMMHGEAKMIKQLNQTVVQYGKSTI